MPKFEVETKHSIGDKLWYYVLSSYPTKFTQGVVKDIQFKEGRLMYIMESVHVQEVVEKDLHFRDPMEKFNV